MKTYKTPEGQRHSDIRTGEGDYLYADMPSDYRNNPDYVKLWADATNFMRATNALNPGNVRRLNQAFRRYGRDHEKLKQEITRIKRELHG